MLIRRKTLIALAAAFAAAGTGVPTADAATTCTLANDLLEVHMTADRDSAHLATLANTQITVSGRSGAVACSGGVPTTANTDTVLIVDDSENLETATGNDGRTQLSIHEPADFGPGKTSESTGQSEIEFLVDPKGGQDEVVAGGQREQTIWVGNGGMSWTSDDDADMIGMPFERVFLHGDKAFDLLSGQGRNGTGGPLSTGEAFAVSGGGSSGNFLFGSNNPSGDAISGGDGGDLISGGAGDDSMSGGFGDDTVIGGSGSDTIHFYDGDSPADARGVTVDLGQAEAQDTGEGRDTIAEVENVVGSIYVDRLIGSADVNVIDGDGGDDTLDGRGGADDLRGGAGSDAVSYAQAPAAVTLDLARTTQPTDGDRLNSIENAIGSPFADTLAGNLVANTIIGGPGADTIAAGDGADRVEVRDGDGDRVGCGADADTAISDRRSVDAVDGDCETVDALPEPAEPEGQPIDPTTTPETTPDTALSVSLSGASRQRLLRQRAVRVKVSCPLEACTTVASGSARLRAVASSRLPATRLKLGPRITRVAAGTTGTVKLSLTRKQLSALRKALTAGQRPKVKVTVRARDAAGNTVERTLRVTARR
jgi:Ca2+-binding RTX toxin-like protein